VVKCSECGYIAARNCETRQLEEMEKDHRGSGNLPGHKYVRVPVCFVMASDHYGDAHAMFLSIRDKMASPAKDHFEPQWEKYVKEIINRERDCPLFVKWKQGSTPKEHQEMMDREVMLKWQAEREEADRKWREQQEKWHSAEEWRRYIFLAVITVLAVIIGVLLGHFTK